MFEHSIEFLQVVAMKYGIFGLFFAEVIEEIIVPVPSAAVMMFGGFLYLGGEPFVVGSFEKLFLEVALPLALGLTVGSLFVYFLTYFFGRPLIDRYGKYLGVSWGDVERAQELFKKGWGDEVLFLAVRAIPLVPSVAVNAFSGLTRMPLKKYILLTFCGSYLRGVIMGFVGWQAGSVYFRYANFIDRIEKVVLVLIVLSIVSFVVYRIIKKPPPSSPEGKRETVETTGSVDDLRAL